MTDSPTGWACASLSEICHVEMGQSPPSSTYNTDRDGLPFLQGKAEFGKLYPTPAKYCSRPSKIAKPGAVLLSVRAPVGPTNVTPNECCIGRGLAAIQPIGDIPNRFILWALRHHAPALVKSGSGSTFAAVSKAQRDRPGRRKPLRRAKDDRSLPALPAQVRFRGPSHRRLAGGEFGQAGVPGRASGRRRGRSDKEYSTTRYASGMGRATLADSPSSDLARCAPHQRQIGHGAEGRVPCASPDRSQERQDRPSSV